VRDGRRWGDTPGNHQSSSKLSEAYCDTARHRYLRTVNPSAVNRSDDTFDDNSDDSCCPSDDAYTPISGRSCLVTASARSWQSGGQGRAAGGHRLFTANDWESTGIFRFLPEVGDS
jgi:hypothetical protein